MPNGSTIFVAPAQHASVSATGRFRIIRSAAVPGASSAWIAASHASICVSASADAARAGRVRDEHHLVRVRPVRLLQPLAHHERVHASVDVAGRQVG